MKVPRGPAYVLRGDLQSAGWGSSLRQEQEQGWIGVAVRCSFLLLVLFSAAGAVLA